MGRVGFAWTGANGALPDSPKFVRFKFSPGLPLLLPGHEARRRDAVLFEKAGCQPPNRNLFVLSSWSVPNYRRAALVAARFAG